MVFISGGGTNLQALIDAVEQDELDAEIVLVVSNKKKAYGLIRAEKAGIPTVYAPLGAVKRMGLTREEYDGQVAEKVAEYQPDLIVLAGWMHIFSDAFLSHFPKKVINLHPALPGQFDGVNAISRAFEAFQKGEIEHTGVMVHEVTTVLDGGPVILTEIVPIMPTDGLGHLIERVHAVEHELLIRAVKKIVNGE